MSTSSFFNHGVTPTVTTSNNSDAVYSLGVCFATGTSGQITSIWYYVADTNSGGITGTAMVHAGAAPGIGAHPSLLGSQSFTYNSTIGWQEVVFDTPVTIAAGGFGLGSSFYVASVFLNGAHYATLNGFHASEIIAGDLTAGSQGNGGGNGRFVASGVAAYPDGSSSSGVSYLVDATFTPTGGGGGGGGGGSVVTVTLHSNLPTQNTNSAFNMSLTASSTPTAYTWSVIYGAGSFSSASSATPTFTPTKPGKLILSCTVTAGSDSGTGYITLFAFDLPVSTTGNFSNTTTDSLSASASTSTSKLVRRGGVPSIQTRSLYGHRLSFGDPIVNNKPDYDVAEDAAATYIITVKMERDCTLTRIRFLKAPAAAGTYTVGAWQQGNSTPLTSQKVTLVADSGGWVDVLLNKPVALINGQYYFIGFHSPDGVVIRGQFVLGAQQTAEYPFLIELASGLNSQVASGYTYGSTFTYPSHWLTHGYYIDPVVEWESTDSVYTGGTDYFKRWQAYSGFSNFPIGIWRPPATNMATYAGYGINTTVGSSEPYEVARPYMVSSGLDIIVDASDGVDTIAVFREDPAFYNKLRAYFIRDEPDLIGPYASPAQLQSLYTEIRKRDSSKMILLNLGFPTVLNQGFAYLPSGAPIGSANATWRQYAQLSDITSCDFYMEDSANWNGNLGLWCNPRITKRMMDLCENKHPVWCYIQTSAPGSRQPSTQLIYSSVWSHLIAGARGVMFFDYLFDGGTFISAAGMISNNNTAMIAMITALTARLQSLKDALLGPEGVFEVSVESSNKSVGGVAGIVGGEFGVPIHFTARGDFSYHYLFAQSIRPGTTTGTFTTSTAGSKTITVIDENRTLTATGGVFTDNFTADYQVHLYRWDLDF